MTDAPQSAGTKRTAREEWNKHAFRYIAGLALLVLGTGTVVYHYVEDWSWVDSFYFSSVTLTTVGFGDFVPTTDASKLFTVFYIFSGISIVGAALSAFLKLHAAEVSNRRSGN
jgi:voltage-gated potassium channel Kch